VEEKERILDSLEQMTEIEIGIENEMEDLHLDLEISLTEEEMIALIMIDKEILKGRERLKEKD
jgi:hypothetical protein